MIYNSFQKRELGSTPIAYNFEVLTASPLDSRTVVHASNKLYNENFWNINNMPTYLYPGLVVTDINSDNTTFKQYVYKGEQYVTKTNADNAARIPGIWQCITFTNNNEQVEYPLNWNANPHDIDINLNQYTLYLGDSSNGEILLRNAADNRAHCSLVMNEDNITLEYGQQYFIKLDNTNGIHLSNANKTVGIQLTPDNNAKITAKNIITDSLSYTINSKNNFNINSDNITETSKNYNINTSLGNIDASTLNLNNTSLNINNNELNVISKNSKYNLAHNKIYTSDYTIYYVNPDELNTNDNNTLAELGLPCIQISENDPNSSKPILSLRNYITDFPSYLEFFNTGHVNMQAAGGINITALNGNSIIMNSNNNRILMDENNITVESSKKIDLITKNNKLELTDTSISLISDNIMLWNQKYLLPIPDNNKVELLQFNKNKLEWTDSAFLKSAYINRTSLETNKPATIRIAQSTYIYGDNPEAWKPSITFSANTREGSGIFNAQVLPIIKSPGKVDYILNIQCINNRNMFNTADNIPYVTGRIFYKNGNQYVEHPYNNPNTTVICEIYVVTSYYQANWAYISYTNDSIYNTLNRNYNTWKLTENVVKDSNDTENVINIPQGIISLNPPIILGPGGPGGNTPNLVLGTTWDVTKYMYSEYEVLPHIVKNINFTSVGQTRYSFNEIPYPVESDFGKFLQVDSNNNFVWNEAAMKTYNAEEKNYILGTIEPAQGKTITKSTYQEMIYFTNTGDMYARNYYATSDINKKTDIHNIDDISINNDIHTVAFKWKDTSIQSYGFIAQELEKTNPELINTDENGFKTVNYIAALSLYTAQLEKKIKNLEKIIQSKL